MTDSKEWCDGDWRCRSSSKPFAGAESGSPGRALEAGKRGSPGRPVQAGIRGKRLMMDIFERECMLWDSVWSVTLKTDIAFDAECVSHAPCNASNTCRFLDHLN